MRARFVIEAEREQLVRGDRHIGVAWIPYAEPNQVTDIRIKVQRPSLDHP
ncbi:MAG: hypothetical protein MJB57_00350 [Gemmatimonadetes bacterium]|nr:hypothetical protein [Gemmatimonadota bacterium]